MLLQNKNLHIKASNWSSSLWQILCGSQVIYFQQGHPIIFVLCKMWVQLQSAVEQSAGPGGMQGLQGFHSVPRPQDISSRYKTLGLLPDQKINISLKKNLKTLYFCTPEATGLQNKQLKFGEMALSSLLAAYFASHRIRPSQMLKLTLWWSDKTILCWNHSQGISRDLFTFTF